MALTLLRHTTPAVAPGTCYGRSDLELAEGFEQEAALVLEALGPVAQVVSSPLQRCLKLARLVAESRGVEMSVSTDWIEMDFGSWEGRRWSEISRSDLDAWAGDFMDYRGHGGESVTSLARRVARGIDAAPEGALVVTHAGCIKAALWLRQQVADPWRAQTAFGGLVALA